MTIPKTRTSNPATANPTAALDLDVAIMLHCCLFVAHCTNNCNLEKSMSLKKWNCRLHADSALCEYCLYPNCQLNIKNTNKYIYKKRPRYDRSGWQHEQTDYILHFIYLLKSKFLWLKKNSLKRVDWISRFAVVFMVSSITTPLREDFGSCSPTSVPFNGITGCGGCC